jgi:hypothetical protein
LGFGGGTDESSAAPPPPQPTRTTRAASLELPLPASNALFFVRRIAHALW